MIRNLVVLGLVLAVAGIAQADTIDFSTLVGSNGDSYSGHSQAGFTVTPTSGSWEEGHLFGNPVPSIFSSSNSAFVKVTENGGADFTFTSVDLANGSTGTSTGFNYLIEGFNNGGLVFSIAGSTPPPGPASFATIPGTSSAAIDEVTIGISSSNTSSYNIDNIVLNENPVPEPSTVALLAVAGLGLAIRRRRKSA